MTPQLLLFDLDGTLLDRDRSIRPATRAALADAMDAGLHVGFATGRSALSVRPFLDAVRPNGPCVLLNGCMLWDPIEAAAVATRTLPRPDAVHIVRASLELGIHANVYIGDDLFVRARGPLSRASELKDGVPHIAVGDLVDRVERHPAAPFKILCIDESGDFTSLRARLGELLASDCTIVQSEPTYLEILPAGVHKGAMLPEIERLYGIASAEVVEFGDELNDAELLRAAGRAVVMGNANPAIAHLASDVIGAHDTDAIAEFVRALLVARGAD